jgi:hypothetical protein
LWPAIRARLTIAIVTLVLSAFAAAAAAAGPFYDSVARQRSRVAEVLAAPLDQRSIVATRPYPGPEVMALPYLPGWESVFGVIIPGKIRGWPGDQQPMLTSRSGACAHLTVASGRCANADFEVMVRADTARVLNLSLGSELIFDQLRLIVVGTYHFLDASDPFWSLREQLIGSPGGPLIVTARTTDAARQPGATTADLIATPAGFTDLAGLTRNLEDAQEQFMAGQFAVSTETPSLIATIEESDRLLRTSLVLAVVPLVLLSWMVLFLAVTGAVEQRRGELGLAALRGVPAGWRWLLPALETAIPVLAGALPGYFLGYLAVQAIAGGAPSSGWDALLYVAMAAGGALAAGSAAQIKSLTAPVLSLLRRAQPVKPGGARQIAEIAVAVLAMAAGAQAIFAGTGKGGAGMLAPVCLALGLGLAGARLLAGPSNRLGRWALRRGLARTGLIALSLARRPGTPAMVTLLTVVFGMFGFALAASNTSDDARQQRAAIEIGAARVIRVDRMNIADLLQAVRKADPQGEFAMAAAEFAGLPDVPILAVDSERLSRVVSWPESQAKLLRPQAPQPLLLKAKQLSLTVDTKLPGDKSYVLINIKLISTDGRSVTLHTDNLIEGKSTYAVPSMECSEGCRLDEVEVKFQSQTAALEVVLGEIRDENGKVLLSAAEAGDPQKWSQGRTSKNVLSGGTDGLKITVPERGGEDPRIYPLAIPQPLPAITAGVPPQDLTGHSGTVNYAVSEATRLPLIPRFGGRGIVMDISYIDLGPAGGSVLSNPEIWLNTSAPPDVLDRLRSAGLVILEERTIATRQQELRDQGPALATRFLLFSTGGALIIAAGALLVAAVLERNRPEDGLGALRVHGVSAHTLGSVASGTRWVALVLSAGLGLAAAAASWALARHVIPVFTDGSRLVRIPTLPAFSALGLPLALSFVALVLISWLAARVASSGGSER